MTYVTDLLMVQWIDLVERTNRQTGIATLTVFLDEHT